MQSISEASPQLRIDTKFTNCLELVLIRVIRVLRRLVLFTTGFDIQGAWAVKCFALACLILGGGVRGAVMRCDAAVIYPKAPEGGREIVSQEVSKVLGFDTRFLGGLRFEELTIAVPYQDYYVGLTNLASGRLLSVARPGGWYYPLMHGTNAAGVAGLIADEKAGKALRANGVFQSNFSSELLEALRSAQQLPQIQQQDYELRRLDIAPLLFVAVWLHSRSDDIIIPLPPTFGRWNAYQPYSERQILQLLKPEAKKKLKAPAGLFGSRELQSN